MADISNIVGYRIVFPGCGWWPNKKLNQSRNKVYCKQYEIELTFDNGKTFKDVMIHGAKGAGRDCYFLQETDLCLKMYPELAYTTNEKEAAGSAKFQPLVPMHLPQVVRQRREEVDTHSNKKVLSDTLLVQMVGETLGTRLGKVATKTCDAALQQEMVQWLRDIAIMTENLTRVKLQWNEDFHCENIAWYEKTKTWYVIDLEHWETTTQTCQQQWSAAGKRLLRDMELHRSDAGMFFFQMLRDWLRGPQISSAVLQQRIAAVPQEIATGAEQTLPANHHEAWGGDAASSSTAAKTRTPEEEVHARQIVGFSDCCRQSIRFARTCRTCSNIRQSLIAMPRVGVR